MTPKRIIVGGDSEEIYFNALLPVETGQGSEHVTVLNAKGDSNIPRLVEGGPLSGSTFVIYDSDAVMRKKEQASVLSNVHVRYQVLSSDFEGIFDAEVLHLALADMGYQLELRQIASIDTNRQVFPQLCGIVGETTGSLKLSKTSLARALAKWSIMLSYFPEELRSVIDFASEQSSSPLGELPSGLSGCLYTCSHIKNNELRIIELGCNVTRTVALNAEYEGTIAIFDEGRQAVVRKFDRGHDGFPISTQITHLSIDKSKAEVVRSFRLMGSVYGLALTRDETGLLANIQEGDKRHGLRLRFDGTGQDRSDEPFPIGLYDARAYKNSRSTASGPSPIQVNIHNGSTMRFPHLYGHSYVWAFGGWQVAFIAKRWHKAPDNLFIYDAKTNRLHRIAEGLANIPVYWAKGPN